ncbi:hypothetical protein GCM10010168_21020 [Actinoplanes ianthinogenes]|uniref:Uncharacterized protein n=1 Tax=Actinoplanes ianthinogenes TaxID=122358 RepID=A0ABN6CR82_9ACTN|nr:hypothetical protein Aiant_84000 [Actinoplanes ianthinogenes]GGR03862.1 hypothetical protein GCM10010168_21020 [Actinoplanes ianthinogenes]
MGGRIRPGEVWSAPGRHTRQQVPSHARAFNRSHAPCHWLESPANGPELEYCQNDQVGAPAGNVPGALAYRASHSGEFAQNSELVPGAGGPPVRGRVDDRPPPGKRVIPIQERRDPAPHRRL